MNIDEFRNALRILLNDAVNSGIEIDQLLEAADAELHPAFDLDDIGSPASNASSVAGGTCSHGTELAKHCDDCAAEPHSR